jgi:hypothetical protein
MCNGPLAVLTTLLLHTVRPSSAAIIDWAVQLSQGPGTPSVVADGSGGVYGASGSQVWHMNSTGGYEWIVTPVVGAATCLSIAADAGGYTVVTGEFEGNASNAARHSNLDVGRIERPVNPSLCDSLRRHRHSHVVDWSGWRRLRHALDEFGRRGLGGRGGWRLIRVRSRRGIRWRGRRCGRTAHEVEIRYEWKPRCCSV